MAYVYLHKRLDNDEIFYVGIGSDLKYKRAHEKRSRTKFWNNITNKIGYTVLIYKDNLSIDDACNEEIRLIKFYGRRDKELGSLVNMDDGGKIHMNRIVTDDIREKISKTLKEKQYKTTAKLSNEIVVNICEQIMLGKHQKEICEIYPQLTKGMFYQIYYRFTWKNITDKYDFPKIKRVYVVDDTTKEKISKKLQGKYYGETIKIKCLNDGNEYKSITEASKFYNLDYKQIHHLLNKSGKKYKNSIHLDFITI
jgi:hypothetical protein